jgi:hypothetical protein
MNIEEAIEYGKKAKEAHARGDYPFKVLHEAILIRGDMKFMIYPEGHEPREWPKGQTYNTKWHLMAAARAACAGLNPDELVFVLDAFHQRTETPIEVNGQRTSEERVRLENSEFKGSMMTAWNAGRGDEFGIGEGLIVTFSSRNEDGTVAFKNATVPYKSKGCIVDWDDDPKWKAAAMAEGRIFDAVAAAFKERDFFPEQMAKDPIMRLAREGLDEEQMRFHADIGIARYLMKDMGVLMLVSCPDFAKLQAYSAHIDKYRDLYSSSVMDNREQRRAKKKQR